MIIINDILVSDEILHERFICDLTQCKGACCIEGDVGAPLAQHELEKITAVYQIIKNDLTPEAQKEIDNVGLYLQDELFENVTPTVNNGLCVYGIIDEKGIVQCLIEKAYNEGKTDFKKPISCHLYPIRVTKNEHYTSLNYEPREVLCAPACSLGKKLGVKVYTFLKEPLIRKFGEAFYNDLDEIANSLSKNK